MVALVGVGCWWALRDAASVSPTTSGGPDAAAPRDRTSDVGRDDAVVDATRRDGARVDVRVLRPDGTPAAGAHVRLVASKGGTVERDADTRGACSFVARERLECSPVGLVPGACTLGAEAPGLAASIVEFDLAPDERRAVELHLARSVAYAGVVVDDRGARMPNVKIEAMSARHPERGPWSHGDVTRADGSFHLEGLAAGDLIVDLTAPKGDVSPRQFTASAPAADVRLVLPHDGGVVFHLLAPPGAAHAKACRASLFPTDSAEATSTCVVSLSNDVGRVRAPAGTWRLVVTTDVSLPVEREVRVAPGADTALGDLALDPGLTLAGRVVDANGSPVAGALVVLGRPDAAGESGRSGGDLTSADGAFRLDHVAPGAATISVCSGDFVDVAVTRDVAAGSPPLVVTLHRGGLVRGTVRDAAGNPATAIAVFALVRDAPEAALSVDAFGAFSGRVHEGRVRVVVSRGGAELAAKDVDVRENGETSVDFTLPR